MFIFYLLKDKYRNIFLLILSSCFIVSFDYKLLFYILFYSLINYLIGHKISTSKFKKTLFRTGILLNILQIILFKYYDFLLEPVFKLINYTSRFPGLNKIIIPMGISYFTLQGIGYLVNVKMGWEKPEKKYFNFLLYIIFFPKFISGPIERSNHFLPQIKIPKCFNEHQITKGLQIALLGFFKKVVIANQLSIIVTGAHSDLNSFVGINLWLVAVIQPIYLYFDFSGYTDIAIGFARIFGIDLLPNFNKPFLSQNVTNFWRRFHISLSSWFNDYIFKQISFKWRRLGKYASVSAVFITFALFGIWHGAGWNFMFLGLLQALAINYEFFTKKIRISIFSKLPDILRLFSGRVFTYLFFSVSLIFFFSFDLENSFKFISSMFEFNYSFDYHLFSWRSAPAIFLATLLLVLELIEEDNNILYGKLKKFWYDHRLFRVATYYLTMMLIISQFGEKLTFVYETF